MILSGPEIIDVITRTRQARKSRLGMGEDASDDALGRPMIDVTPFDPERVGPNSYDVTLGNQLLVYSLSSIQPFLRTDEANPTSSQTLDSGGIILRPGKLYLGTTVERTKCAGVVPWLDGRSSLGRLGVFVHVTAGRGDDGYGCGTPDGCQWTLEIAVVHPVLIKPGIRIGQLSFFYMAGARKPYAGKYKNQTDGPVASRLHQD